MKFSLTSALLVITLMLGCGGVALAAPIATLAPIFAADARKDYATELKLLRPLVDKGDVDAQFLLGVMYDNGQGVAQDYKEAVRLYRLAAEQGNVKAQNNLGFMYDNGTGVAQDYVRAHMWYNLGAISGDSRNASSNRDDIAKRMTPSQIERAQDLARKCQASKFKKCD